MIRYALAVVLCLFAPSLFAGISCTSDPGTACDGHKHLLNSAYAFTEDFGVVPNTLTQKSVVDPNRFTTIAEGCPQRNLINFTNDAAAHVVMRAWVLISSATAPAGSRLNFRFVMDGVVRGEYVRTLRGPGQYPQGEEFGSVYVTLPGSSAGKRLKVQAWLEDGPGTVTIGQVLLIAQGTPTSNGAATTANGSTMTIDGTWRQISSTINVTSATDVNLLVQAYFQVNSGTPGQRISVGFSLDGASSQRHSEVAVPAYFPSGINIMDHYKSKPGFVQVPSGTRTISVWARMPDGGSAVIQHREVEAIAFPVTNDAETKMVEAIATNAKTIAKNGDGTVVYDPLLQGGCGWTNILQFMYPMVPSTVSQNTIGEAFVEFLGTANGLPQNVFLAIEILKDPICRDQFGMEVPCTDTSTVVGVRNAPGQSKPATADFTFVGFRIPGGRHQKVSFTHALLWGYDGAPTMVRFLLSHSACGAPTASAFFVGKRWMEIKAVTIPEPPGNQISCQFD